jgi:ATP/maltotriose-dependent transcriptional regulator MalT
MAEAASQSWWPLVGRASELARVDEALAGRTGGLLIAGEAGVGKTRLAAEAAARATGLRVVRVAASSSLRAVPLGAFSAVLPAQAGQAPRQPAELLWTVVEQHAPAGEAPPLVCVDDAQLLDELSAGLALELAAGGRARLLVTLRTGEPCPEAVRRLWRDGHLCRLDLQPLGAEETAELVARALGGPLDGATLQRIWSASRGNLLYLRELVRIGLDSGALARRGEIWIWDGPLVVSTELRDLIAERMAGLDEPTLAALEAAAVAEPFPHAIAERLGIADRLVDLERRGLLRVDAQGEHRLAHPLFGQVLRAGLAPLRAAELARSHAAALDETGGDLLRRAIAQADGYAPPDPALLLAASLRARVLADPALATRLARAAVAAGGGARAVAVTAECLFWEQRYGEVLALLDATPIDERDVDARIVALHNRASALYWGFGRADEAIAELLRAEALAPGHPLAVQAAGQRAVVLCDEGRAEEAIALARRILDGPASRVPERVYAHSASTLARATVGRFAEALAEAERALPLALSVGDELPTAGDGIVVGAVVSWFLGGQFAALEAMIAPIYRERAALGDPFLGVWAFFLARNEVARGRLVEADRRGSEAVALLRRRDPGMVLPWALASLAQVAAQRGDAGRARALVEELDRQPAHMAACEGEMDLARAWTQAAAGELPAARRRALAAARRELGRGLFGVAGFVAHEAARLGAVGDAAALMAEIAPRVDGALPAAWADHARALAAHDAAALESAGESLAAIGACLHAAEAMAAAAALHREAGRKGAAQRTAGRALALAVPCGAPRTPALAPLRAAPTAALTPRELHVARLAACGRTRREIATELALSMRTVSNHLNHVYAKLGVADRAALLALLGEGAAAAPGKHS